jgi:hypothetical protein
MFVSALISRSPHFSVLTTMAAQMKSVCQSDGACTINKPDFLNNFDIDTTENGTD